MDREKLIRAGIDYDDGLRRFVGKTAMYEKFLHRIFETDELETLGAQLRAGDYREAFRTAHSLKGGSGNLSMKAVFEAVCPLVEALRGETVQGDVNAMYQRVVEEYARAKAAVEEA